MALPTAQWPSPHPPEKGEQALASACFQEDMEALKLEVLAPPTPSPS